MRKTAFAVAAMALMSLSGCGTMGSPTGASGSQAGSILGSVLGAATDGQTIGNILASVLGVDKPAEQDLYGNWRYSQPGVAFTSDNALAKAGGEVAATEARNQLAETYNRLGVTSSNTQLSFKSDKTFNGLLAGKRIAGTWTYEQDKQRLTLKTLLFSLPVYARRTTTGMSYLMESKKLLTALQTLASLSGNSDLQAIGDLSKNYDGVRLGFDMRK